MREERRRARERRRDTRRRRRRRSRRRRTAASRPRTRARASRRRRASSSRRAKRRATASSTRRRLQPAASARATIAAVASPVAIVERVEERRRGDVEAEPREAFAQDRRQPVHAPRDRRQALGAVVDGVHAGDHGEQHLRRADVRRRLFAPDVLLARLQREPVRGRARRVDGDADEPAGQRALERVARRHERRVRAAEAHRHAEALRRADDDVGAPFAGRREQRQREQVGRDDDERAARVQRRRRARGNRARRRRRPDIAAARANASASRRLGGRADDDVDAERRGARAHDVDRLREHIVGDEERAALRRARRAGTASSPRPRPSPRRASTRWRSPCR